MKKSIIFAAVALSMVLGSSYYVCGRIIQKTYYQNITQLNANREYKINIISYKTGFLNSEAKLEIALDTGSKINNKKIILQQNISHGPIVTVNSTQGFSIKPAAAVITTTLADELQQQLITLTNNTKPLTITTLINFNQTAHTWLILNALDQTANKADIAWATIIGEMKHDLTLTNYQGNLNIPKLSIKADNNTFSISDLILYFNAGKQELGYYHNNVIQTKTISYNRNNHEDLKLDNLSVNLNISSDLQQHFGFNLEVTVPEAQILDQHFVNDVAKMQIMNINSINVPKFGLYNSLSLKNLIDIAQQITASKETNMKLELPKELSNSLLSYVSFELYRTSILGKFDNRDETTIRKDINNSINGLIQSVLRQKLFIEQGKFYALNFEGITNAKS